MLLSAIHLQQDAARDVGAFFLSTTTIDSLDDQASHIRQR